MYKYITNPINGKSYNYNSKYGLNILRKYLKNLRGGTEKNDDNSNKNHIFKNCNIESNSEEKCNQNPNGNLYCHLNVNKDGKYSNKGICQPWKNVKIDENSKVSCDHNDDFCLDKYGLLRPQECFQSLRTEILSNFQASKPQNLDSGS